MRYAAIFVLCLIAWLVFSGKFDPFHLGLGVLSATLVTIFTTNYFFSDDMIRPGFSLRKIAAIIVYFAWLIGEIFTANLYVFYLAVHPRPREEISPRVVRFTTRLKSDFAKFVLGNSITLTPGTVTVKIEQGVFTVHAISAKTASGLEHMEARVAEVFDS